MTISNIKLDKRSFLKTSFALAGTGLFAGCSSNVNQTLQPTSTNAALVNQPANFNYDQAYGAVVDTEVSLPAFDYRKMDPKYLRQWVTYRRKDKPGTIVVDGANKYLYLVHSGNRALRYGTAVGKEGHAWYGDAIMKWKQKWPTWTPPPEMIARTPRLAEFADGMPAGVDNPLGARAMYLFKDGRDTLFRIHGTNRPFSIGKAASSGCFRMINQDAIDLYERVKPGAEVYVVANVQAEEFAR